MSDLDGRWSYDFRPSSPRQGGPNRTRKDSRRGRDWRHSSSKPIIDALYLWLDRQLTQVQGRSGSCRGDPLWTRAMG